MIGKRRLLVGGFRLCRITIRAADSFNGECGTAAVTGNFLGAWMGYFE